MISSNDFRPGVTVEIDGNVWQVVDFQHVKPGKGAAFVRTKMKNLQTGSVVERTFNAGEKCLKHMLIVVVCNTYMSLMALIHSWITKLMIKLNLPLNN